MGVFATGGYLVDKVWTKALHTDMRSVMKRFRYGVVLRWSAAVRIVENFSSDSVGMRSEVRGEIFAALGSAN